MIKRHSPVFGFILGGMIVLFSTSLFAWRAMTNPPSTWRNLPVPYYVNNSGCADIGGFDAAVNICEISFDSWENNDCTSWQVSYMGGTSASPLNSGDGQWVMGWVESGWPYEPYAIGVTMVMFGSGSIWGADIAFNAVSFTWTTSGGGGMNVDSQSIASHEEGHFLGLDHPACTMGQTMCASYSGGIRERDLTSDDIDGVCSLYPGTGPPPTCTTSDDCDDFFECIEGDCKGMMCAPCSSHDDCGIEDDYCLSGFPDGNLYCGASCVTDGECGAGNSCFDLGGGIKQCLPSNFDCTGAGVECTVSTDCPPGYICEGGSCIPQPPPECVTDDDCAPGYICQDDVCVVDALPHFPRCTPCSVNEECGWENDHCITYFPDGTPFADGLSYCGVSCDSMGGDCGWGFACFEFSDRPAQCLPENQSCRTCDPIYMTGCDEGYYCDFVNCITGICLPGVPGPAPLGDSCSVDTDCETLQCVEQVEDSFCSASCAFGSSTDLCFQLDDNFTCQPRDFGACGYCSCASGRLADTCDENSDCQSGGCFTLPNGDGSIRVCSMLCGGVVTCPPNYECQYSPDDTWGCFPIIPRPGEPCDEFTRCLGGMCNVEEGYCSRYCEGDCKCPVDMHCETNSEGREVCVQGHPSKSGCGSCILVENGHFNPLSLLLILFTILSLIIIMRLRGQVHDRETNPHL